MENWRWYISELEKRYIVMKSKSQLTRINEKGEFAGSMTGVRIEDTQEIQVLQDKCQQMVHVLTLNETVLRGKVNELASSFPLYDGQESLEIHSLHSLVSEAGIHVTRVNHLLKRLDGTIALTRTILDSCCLASLQKNSDMMMTMTHLAQEDNTRMRHLTEKASRDTALMKWITLLTLCTCPLRSLHQ